MTGGGLTLPKFRYSEKAVKFEKKCPIIFDITL